MGKLILITGGAKSGKSSEAERQVRQFASGKVAYIATQSNVVKDEETAHNIRVHQARRPGNWDTIEDFRDLDRVIEKATDKQYQAYLIDCLTLWTSNLFFEELPRFLAQKYSIAKPAPDKYDDYIEDLNAEDIAYFDRFFDDKLTKMIDQINKSNATFWLVTNEIGMGLVPPTKLGRLYREWLGKINQKVAQAADDVYLTVSGITIKIKGE